MTSTPHAEQADQVTPTNDKARGANAGQVGHQETVQTDCRAERVTDQDQECDSARKALTGLQARAALAGYELLAGQDGFIITRWGHLKDLPDIAAAERFLRQIGAPA